MGSVPFPCSPMPLEGGVGRSRPSSRRPPMVESALEGIRGAALVLVDMLESRDT